MGAVVDNAHEPAEQSFFATFCSQKVGLPFLLALPLNLF
jgi:hypothetical protein